MLWLSRLGRWADRHVVIAPRRSHSRPTTTTQAPKVGGGRHSRRVMLSQASPASRSKGATRGPAKDSSESSPSSFLPQEDFPCAVLSDGETRVLTQSDFMDAMGMYYSGWVAKNRSEEDRAAEVPHFLSFKSLKPYVDRHLGDLQEGRLVHVRAELLPLLLVLRHAPS